MMRNRVKQVTQNLNLRYPGFTLVVQKFRRNSTKGPLRIVEWQISNWEKIACTLTEALVNKVNVYLEC
jgi:hypothetical protein